MEISNQQRNIVVIGGGPAGIEASRALDAMGYTVFLVERDSRLGGHLGRWDRLFPYGTPAEDVLSQLTASMGRIKWFTSTEVTQVNKLERGYNVILSNGLSVLADALLLTTGPASPFSTHPRRRNTATASMTGSSPTRTWRTGSPVYRCLPSTIPAA